MEYLNLNTKTIKLNTKAMLVSFAIALMLVTFFASSNGNLNYAFAQPVSPMPDEPTLDPLSIPKYTDQLIIPPYTRQKMFTTHVVD